MKICFLGAANEVTGSRTLLEVGGKYALVDCGMEQGPDVFENKLPPVRAGEIDYVFLTHAHIDHSGNLPLLYRQGFRGKIYATPETCNLCEILLRDSAHIQMMEAAEQTKKAKRRGEGPVLPLFDMADAEGALSLMVPYKYGRRVRVDEGIELRFTDIGHLLGSAAIELWLREGGIEKKIVFSGDIGNTNQPIIKDPQKIKETDYLVVESTYGDRLHEAGEDPIPALTEAISRTMKRGGNVIIPAFSVGRTQEMLYFIREIKEKRLIPDYPDFPVYVDSPLASEATAVFLQCDPDCFDQSTRDIMLRGQNPLYFEGLKLSVTTEESKGLNLDPTPKVIVSASGMCDAGRVRHHLKHNLWRPECLILFVGYQANGSLGRIILDGAPSVRLFGEQVRVRAEIARLQGTSGHADQTGLLDWIDGYESKPAQVFVNHGEHEVCQFFAGLLAQTRGLSAYAPYSGTFYDLALGEFIEMPSGIPVQKKARDIIKTRNQQVHQNLLEAVRELQTVAEGMRGMANKDLAKLTDQVLNLTRKWQK
ncbi:MAG: MBL fold metallo-hydrolase [Eubacteriales bacterium]